MVRVGFVGDVEPQAGLVWEYLDGQDIELVDGYEYEPELVIVAGFRKLLRRELLAIPRLGTVGFHSAKLPEYPGRAPVPWTLLRGDEYAYNTMLYLDEGVDSGDIIDWRRVRVEPGETPDDLYEWMAASCVVLLGAHLPALLAGTAVRKPQDPAKRGPLTKKDGWARYFERERLATGHA